MSSWTGVSSEPGAVVAMKLVEGPDAALVVELADGLAALAGQRLN